MIKVNNRNFAWVQGLTVQELLAQKNYVYSNIMVKINGVYIPPEKYATTLVSDGDDVLALHMFGGG